MNTIHVWLLQLQEELKVVTISFTSDYGEYHFKMVLCASNDDRGSTIFFDCPACCMMMLAFIWITPSFERMSYYTLLP